MRDATSSNASAKTPLNTFNEGSDILSIPPLSATPRNINHSELYLDSPLNYGTPSSIGSIRTPRSGMQNTPLKMRPDIRIPKHMRQVNVGQMDTISESCQLEQGVTQSQTHSQTQLMVVVYKY
jgi:hypothetical protein